MINTFVALDIETTGLNPAEDKIIEIGMAKISDGEIVDSYSTLVNPGIKISERITMITGITDDMVEGKPAITEIISDIVDFTKDMPILGHNVIFDYSFIKKAAVNSGLDFKKSGIDTLKLSRRLLPEVPHKTLEYLCGYFGIDAGNSHRAYDDALRAMKLYEKLHQIKPDDTGFDELIELNYSAKKDSPITAAQRKYLIALTEKHGLEPVEDIDALTKSRASKLIDNIISNYGK